MVARTSSIALIATILVSVSVAQIPPQLWSVVVPDCTDLCTTADGNPVLVTQLQSATTIGDSIVAPVGYEDGLILLFDDAGDLSWSRTISQPTSGEFDPPPRVLGVASDGTGGILVAGDYHDDLHFDATHVLPASGKHTFVAHYGVDGSVIWADSLVIEPSGDLVGICGDGSGGAFTFTRRYGEAPDGGPVVTHRDPAGVQQWQVAASQGEGLGSAIGDDGFGNAVIVGSFVGSLTFGDSTVVAGGVGMYLASMAANGSLNWLRGFDSSMEYLDLAVGTDGEITICGRYVGVATFPGVTFYSSSILFEGFVARYDATGSFKWARRYGAVDGSGSVQAVNVAALPNGNAIVTSVDVPGVFVAGDSILAGENGHAGSLVTEWAPDGSLVDLFSAGTGNGWGDGIVRPVASRADGGVFRFEFSQETPERALVAHLEATTAAPQARTAGRARLLPNSPNPFNAHTEIRFELVQPAQVELTIHDLAGRHVRTLISGLRGSGLHQPVWDGRNDAGHSVASGVYIARLVAGTDEDSHKLLLVE